MDPRFMIDPATGMPAVPMSGGGTLPLALSHDDFRAALAANQTPVAPGGYDPASGTFVPVAPRAPAPMSPEQMRAALQPPPPPPAPAAHASQGPIGPAPLPHGLDPRFNDPTPLAKPQAAPGPGAVDPSELARPGAGAAGGGGQQPDPAAGGMDDPLVRQAMAEAMRGGGGGGPRGLGVTGETRKFKEVGAVPSEVSAAARNALGASDAYNEQLAISLQQRQEQAYQAYQGEQASRAGELQAQREHFEARQQALQDYAVKRDALAAQAAQMKAPQMEDYWGSRTDMAKMATAVAMALGGAAMGLRGDSRNSGIEASNQDIDRWIIGQKEAYQRAQGAVDAADNKYARMVQAFGSEDLAEKHLRDEAWTVRDGMMKAYAEKIGTPNALEAYNQAQLQSEAQRAANLQAAYQSAGAEIEQKLSMQGGGGGGSGVLKMLRAGAEATKLRDVISGKEKDTGGRAVESGKTEGITGALEAIDAANEVTGHLQKLGYAEDDTDDPRSGAIDYVTKNIPGTQTRRTGQDLDQATFRLARAAQLALGKSDNDAALAERQATGGGGSGRERVQAARLIQKRSVAAIQDALAGMTTDQRRTYINGLPPDRREKLMKVVGSSAGQAPAASERPF